MSNIEFSRDMFSPASTEQRNMEKIKRPSIKYWADVWRRLKMNKLAMVGLSIIIVALLGTVFGFGLNGYKYFEQNYDAINMRPNATHWFGTDELGRDLFTRVWQGTMYSLIIGFSAAFLDLFIGVLYGGIAGMASRNVDAVMMRVAEVIYSIPYMLVVILMSVVFTSEGQGTNLVILVLAMSITGWVPMAILVRGQVLQLKETEYSMAAGSLGATKGWILKKHILPNTLGPILVNLTLTIPRAIFAEATLGFLGLGLQQPKASLGNLANAGLATMPIGLFYQIVIPSLFISMIMFAFNVLGDGVRDALDPRLRK
ncbi:ABC transporter permease [Proteiniclasticum sp. BAD-10]|uniref:ABC transporter permease n=1 Tax=Proteiniclasticum sediminis TaxID=2804028 RepID=A0A941HQK0_9CLOT|nr:ABC transporter permease [Proteiniclasticum sediminis]